MGKLTISMAIFNSKPLVITRGYQENPMKDGRVTRKYQEEWAPMKVLSWRSAEPRGNSDSLSPPGTISGYQSGVEARVISTGATRLSFCVLGCASTPLGRLSLNCTFAESTVVLEQECNQELQAHSICQALLVVINRWWSSANAEAEM